jgi:hypothetical protein
MGRTDPHLIEHEAFIRNFDRPYAAHPTIARLHVGPGALFLIFALVQFSSRVRRRFPAFHRWSGRMLLLLSLFFLVTAFYFAFTSPGGGPGETAVGAIFGVLFIYCAARAFLAIRRGDVARHREWIIRACAIAFGISTVRIAASIIDPVFVSSSYSSAFLFVFSLISGWVISVASAEWWIRRTRRYSLEERILRTPAHPEVLPA